VAPLAPFGTTLELTPNQRIVQAWRTSEFPEDAPDSNVEVLLEEVAEGTRVTFLHRDMPTTGRLISAGLGRFLFQADERIFQITKFQL
jgi:uncharacterized protein YndB with AHSA1/START domain